MTATKTIVVNKIRVDIKNALSLFGEELVHNTTVLDFEDRKELVGRDFSKSQPPRVHTYRRVERGDINEYIYRLGANGSLEENFFERYFIGSSPHFRIDYCMRRAGI